MKRWPPAIILLCCVLPGGSSADGGELPYLFGFGKAEITPRQPLRLSGYGERTQPATGVDEKLFVRAMALQRQGAQLQLLVSVDTIGFPGSLTQRIAKRIAAAHNVPRSRLVLCCTHSHTTPQLDGGLANLLAVPLTTEQQKSSQHYTEWLADQVLEAVARAIDDLQPGRLSVAQGRVGFARNRRIIVDGRHADYGTHTSGPSDLSLPILSITDEQGVLRGLVYNYACHCTTLRGSYNRVNGDWAGYASQAIEAEFPGALALCTIGCGADQDPQPDKSQPPAELAKLYGQQIASEVARLLAGELREITAPVTASFGYAGLPFDRLPIDQFEQRLADRQPQVRRHAGSMLSVHQRMGRLPETYPAPLHVWRFGDQLCMVFLGGEVVVDYALRLQKEIDASQVWVSAYSDDVFGYVASERIRREGGYEAVGSTVFYDLPGPWSAGTEELLIRRIHELDAHGSSVGPRNWQAALETFRLSDGFEIGVVAAEPLIADPVNFEVGADGRLWVVEMGDYPRDEAGQGGRVKLLEDIDGDGRYDRGTTFLEGLAYPNGIFPWRDGVLVSCGGEILFAKDTTGDDRADVTEVLYSGFTEGNPQHRMAGFAMGLDNWLYLSSGEHNGLVTSHRRGDSTELAGQDFRIDPTTGRIEPVGGHTQYGRNRDDWGNWFGGDNSRPIWHYLIADRYLRRNPFVAPPQQHVVLIKPEFAPPVFPASATVDRFNDLFAANRFTSACSPHIYRDLALGADVQSSAFICEPVHNLVHRAPLTADGVTFRSERHRSELASEFVASTDLWFRPTAVKTGPDGAIWIADMYRHVIEHPQWIPEAWQTQLDLRAGEALGRIYRVFRSDHRSGPIPKLAGLSCSQLVLELDKANGWRRDTAQRLLVERDDHSCVAGLAALLGESVNPLAKVHALNTLEGLDALTAEHLLIGLGDADSRVQQQAIALCEPLLTQQGRLQEKLLQLSKSGTLLLDARLRLQLALSLGQWDDARVADALARLAVAAGDDPVLRTAVLSAAGSHSSGILAGLLDQSHDLDNDSLLVQQLVSTAMGRADSEQVAALLAVIGPFDKQPATWQFAALASLDQSLVRLHIEWRDLEKVTTGQMPAALKWAQGIVEAAHQVAVDSAAPLQRRLAAVPLLGRDADSLETIGHLLSAQQPVELQVAAVRCLARIDAKRAAQRLLASWQGLTPQVQSEVLLALLSRPPWHESLVSAIEAGSINAAQLDAATRSRLADLEDHDLRQRSRRALAAAAGRDLSGGRPAPAVVGRAKIDSLDGDRQRGATLFTAKCATCHRHNGLGKDFGPKLAALTDKSTPRLLESIIDPNRAIEGKYKSYTCLTKDGRARHGMIIAETSNSITMVEPNGTEQVLLRLDIEQLQASDISFMPSGLEQGLQPQDFADLFAFLRHDGAPDP